MIEPVVVYGRGARIGMRVEDVEARSKKPLLFEVRIVDLPFNLALFRYDTTT